MKLYDSKLSPYANRVRLQLYLKGIDAQLIDVPSGGSHTAEYAKINPLEKIPALDDNGFLLPESSVIGEYIEDTRPMPSLRPADAKERARMRVIYNIADQYLLTPLFELFEQIDPKVRNAKVVDEQLTELAKGLKGLEHFIAPGKYAMGANASLADCALVPSLFFASGIGPMLGQGDLLAATPKVKAYWGAVQSDPSVAKVIGEMTKALTEFMSRPQ
ncbi:MAG: glutathione S-transferase family protein [Micropepsaceae bacterium]